MECFNCGASGSNVKLFDAITGKGLVKICEMCSIDEHIPIIKRTPIEFREVEKKQTVHERLSSISGVDLSKKEEPNEFQKAQKEVLKTIADNTFQLKGMNEKNSEGLIDNFHWVIMRVRRARKITRSQLAEAIAEPEAAIKMAESGKIPNNYPLLVSKLETYLKINLRKKEEIPEFVNNLPEEEIKIENNFKQGMSFDPVTTKNLTISDLQEMKKRKEEEILDGKEEPELSEKEMKDLIFRGNKEI